MHDGTKRLRDQVRAGPVKIVGASDHAGFAHQGLVLAHLRRNGYDAVGGLTAPSLPDGGLSA